MKAHVIKHTVGGMTYTEACPYCGYVGATETYPEHMQDKHPYTGFNWKLARVKSDMDQYGHINDYWIMQTERKV